MIRLLTIGVLVAGCGSSSGKGGASSAEAAVEAMKKAIESGNAAAVRRVMVKPGRLRQALSCGTGENVFLDLEDALNELDKLAPVVLQGVTIKNRSVTETGRRTVTRGERYRECTATEQFDVRMLAVRTRIEQGGEVESAEETIEVVRFDGRWYVMLR